MEAVDVVVCRTCTNRERRTNMKDILTDQLSIHSFKMHMSIIEAFNEVTRMVVDENEPITTLICLNCVRRLRQAVVFRMTAARSYEKLSKHDSSMFESFEGTTYEMKQIKSEKEQDDDEQFLEADDDLYQVVEVETDDADETRDETDIKEESIETEYEIGRYIKVEVDTKKELKQERRRPRIILESKPKAKIRKAVLPFEPTDKASKGLKETFYCAHCPATFTNKRNTFLHMKKLHMSKKPWKCWIEGCGKLYVSPAQRRFHQEAIHFKIKRHVCDICGLCFTDNPKLQSHRRVHTGERPYKCEEPGCDYAFKQPYDLVKHKMSIHSDERPHTCEFCGTAFKLKGGLRAHRRLMHSRDNLKACPECPKQFLNVAALNNHITVVHRGERNHLCRVCSKTYAYRKHLLRHIKDAHPDEFHNMKLTGAIATRGKVFIPTIFENSVEEEVATTSSTIDNNVYVKSDNNVERNQGNIVRVIVQQY